MNIAEKRSQLPNLINQSFFLSEKVKQRVLNEYQELSEKKVEKLYNFLTKTIAEKKAEKEKKLQESQLKNEQSKETLKKIQAAEAISRQEELAELAAIEEELNNIID